jgi:hypothetical protein
MNDKGVIHEGFELLADLRKSERQAKVENEILKKIISQKTIIKIIGKF